MQQSHSLCSINSLHVSHSTKSRFYLSILAKLLTLQAQGMPITLSATKLPSKWSLTQKIWITLTNASDEAARPKETFTAMNASDSQIRNSKSRRKAGSGFAPAASNSPVAGLICLADCTLGQFYAHFLVSGVFTDYM